MSEEPKEQPARPAGARRTPAGAKTRGGAAGARPAGARPAGARPAGARPAGAKATAAKAPGAEAGAQGEAPAKKAPPQEPKVVLKKFLPVYIVKSDVVEVNCLMCRNQLDEVCNNCRQQRITDPALCPYISGKCGHKFHLHCIQGWLKDHTNCPHPGCEARWENA